MHKNTCIIYVQPNVISIYRIDNIIHKQDKE